jgi:hypothetical protein
MLLSHILRDFNNFAEFVHIVYLSLPEIVSILHICDSRNSPPNLRKMVDFLIVK